MCAEIVKLEESAIVFVISLQLLHGLSRAATRIALAALVSLLHYALHLGVQIGRYQASTGDARPTAVRLAIPKDPDTCCQKFDLEPTLQRSICCPGCYTNYGPWPLPADDAVPVVDVCEVKESARSRACGAELWRSRRSKLGTMQRIPCRLYSTQCFFSWLSFFLKLPGVEDLLDRSCSSRGSSGIMRDIWDGPAWQSHRAYHAESGNLTFSFFVDWFNPYTNKIAGKKASVGNLMMCCLNLPPDLRYHAGYTFQIGLTPGPKEPSVTTINHVLEPLVDALEEAANGVIVSTARSPGGRLVRARLLPNIGDTPGIRKACGAASHSARCFCCFCKLKLADIECLDPDQYLPRTSEETTLASRSWSEATTKKLRATLVKQTGVRYSALHRLSYRDHVGDIVLGVMHNWFEGVLQHHLRRRFGIGVQPSKKEPAAAAPATTAPIDEDAIEDEIMLLQLDARVNGIASTPAPRRRARAVQASPDPDSDSEDEDFAPESDDDDDEDDDADGNNNDNVDEAAASRTVKGVCIFDCGDLKMIHSAISDIILPRWMARPPCNLGEPSHGKLKADEYYVLFAFVFPLVLVEMWSEPLASHIYSSDLLRNLHDLVLCTHIVGAFSTSDKLASLFETTYLKYRLELQDLFPDINSVPNHHYAYHNGALLRHWGPLMLVSEFAYEQENGLLQRIKHNKHLCEFPPLRRFHFLTC